MAGRFVVLLLLLTFLCDAADVDVKIGSFNMRIFGTSKLQIAGVPEILVDIIRRYDLAFLQEIRNADGTAIVQLFNLMNQGLDVPYKMIVSDKLGRTTSTEQYAYFYKTDRISLISSYVYPDTNDTFEREPYVARFNILDASSKSIYDFATIGIHTKPTDTINEINGLLTVYNDLPSSWPVNDVILMGDMNAGCSYVPQYQFPNMPLYTSSDFYWLINNTVDTTSGSTYCPYDRFVVTIPVKKFVASYEVFHFDEAYGLNDQTTFDVSDHYPIEMTLSIPSNSQVKPGSNDENGSGGGSFGNIINPMDMLIFSCLSIILYYFN